MMARPPLDIEARKPFTKGERNGILMRQAASGADDVFRAFCPCGAHLATLKESGWEKEQPTEFDHITPLALGGAHSPLNAQALCETCHSRKTSEDVGSIAKAERQSGRTGQWARQRARRAKGLKPLIQGRGFK